jgi:hypothetical protein
MHFYKKTEIFNHYLALYIEIWYDFVSLYYTGISGLEGKLF